VAIICNRQAQPIYQSTSLKIKRLRKRETVCSLLILPCRNTDSNVILMPRRDIDDYSSFSIPTIYRLLHSRIAQFVRTATGDDVDSSAFAGETGEAVRGTGDPVGKGGHTADKQDAKRVAAEKAISRLEAEGYKLPDDDDPTTRLKMFGDKHPEYGIRFEHTQSGRSFLCVYMMGKRIIGSGGAQRSADE
jgi:hypothetical protein